MFISNFPRTTPASARRDRRREALWRIACLTIRPKFVTHLKHLLYIHRGFFGSKQ